MDHEFQARVRELKQRMQGRWTEFLRSCGIDDKVLSGRNVPCPMCGGRDRFQYTDKFSLGNYHCRGCGAGTGISLLQGALGLSFAECVGAIEKHLGAAPVLRHAVHASESNNFRMQALVRAIWDEARPVTPGDPVDRYLRARGLGLSSYPEVLRFHPALGYYTRDAGQPRSRKVASYPAMVAAVHDREGRLVTLHRTYLGEACKANVPDAKKLLSAGIAGAAVCLFAPAAELAITEGIETALAVHLATGRPVWSAISAGNLERLLIPQPVRVVAIYADNDSKSKFDGQASAYALARRLRQEDSTRRVEVYIPKKAGRDWADVWGARCAARQMAA